ncbi:UNVERIFIED_CONTAM: hypothetical protein Sradi_5689600 [Sesamum radiatum]|uniref:Secreted protein n=1 Tax=Sesamum radiatum TaxID=300843 RepID=A0AAW2L238_SESRA
MVKSHVILTATFRVSWAASAPVPKAEAAFSATKDLGMILKSQKCFRFLNSPLIINTACYAFLLKGNLKGLFSIRECFTLRSNKSLG